MLDSDYKVGVVIAIYNVEPYLRTCLDSVMAQTHKNLSVLLVNDGSSDKSRDIALEYVRKDRRFSLIDKPNLGQASCRNVGIEYFSGDYDFSLDSIESNLAKYTMTNANPYNINALYTATNAPEVTFSNNMDTTAVTFSNDRMRGGGGNLA